MKKKPKNKWRKAMSIALSCAMLATAAPAGILAEEVQNAESTEVTIEEEGTCGEGVTYTLDSEGLLTISGEGEIRKLSFNGRTDITSVVIKEGITSIGEWTFYECSSITSIELPEGLTGIDNLAFGDCSSLKSIELPESLTSISDSVFSGCSNLASIELPEGLTSIGWWAFSGCSSLKSIELPEGLTSVGWWAFSGCSSLASIEIPEGLTSIAAGAFSGCSSLTNIIVPDGNESYRSIDGVLYNKTEDTILCYPAGKSDTTYIIPEKVTSIGDDAFSGCSNLTSMEIPEGVTSIGDDAFSGCSNLTSIEIPEGVTSIGSSPFRNCSSLKSIELPEGLTSIGSYTFLGCSSLTNIVIPNSVTNIDSFAFDDCSGLTNIMVSGGNESYRSIEGVLYNKAGDTILRYPAGRSDATYSIPEKVTSIGDCAFGGCSSITSIELPESLTSIGDDAFEGCSSITSIELPESLTSIGDDAFEGCSSLTSIVIPEGVTSIGDFVFDGCSLTSIVIPEGVTSIGYGAFSACSSLKSIYYAGTAEQWDKIEIKDRALNPRYITIHYESAGSGDSANVIEKGPCGQIVASSTNGTYTLATYTLDSDGLLTISGEGWIIGSAFSGRTDITSVVIEEGITGIGRYAFGGCSNITSIEIPEGVTSIGRRAFEDCSSITSIVIPDSVTNIDSLAFVGCSSLTNINVSEGNECYKDIDGVLFNEAGDTILCYPVGKSDTTYSIPEKVTSIGDSAFRECSSLTSITIPEGVTSIGSFAFYYCSGLMSIEIPNSATNIGGEAFGCCSSLTSIELPENLTSIEGYTFYGCSSLTSIYYAGTEARWNEIEIDPDAGIPDNVKFYFESTGPDETPGDDTTGTPEDDTTGTPGDDTTDTPDIPEDDTTETPDIPEDDTTETPDNSEDVPSDDNTTEDTTPDTPNTNDFCEVVLPTDNTSISTDDFAAILEENKTKDVVITSNNGVSFTFAKGTMSEVGSMENYDFGTTLVSDFAYAGNMGSSVTKDNFVARINYDYSGKLPAAASIRIYAGTDYADQTLYYSQILENGFKFIQSVVVDAEGYATVTQDHCSDYVLTIEKLDTTVPPETPDDSEDVPTETPDNSGDNTTDIPDNSEEDTTDIPDDSEDVPTETPDNTEEDTASPATGDSSNIMWYVMMLVFGTGIAVVGMRRKFHN